MISNHAKYDNINLNRLNYLMNNPVSTRSAGYFTSNLRRSIDPERVSWNSVSKFEAEF